MCVSQCVWIHSSGVFVVMWSLLCFRFIIKYRRWAGLSAQHSICFETSCLTRLRLFEKYIKNNSIFFNWNSFCNIIHLFTVTFDQMTFHDFTVTFDQPINEFMNEPIHSHYTLRTTTTDMVCFWQLSSFWSSSWSWLVYCLAFCIVWERKEG